MKKIIFIVFILTTMTACNKPDQLGPDIKGIFGAVNVTQTLAASNSNPNFANNDKVYFTAKFENDAVWTLTIIGNTSGAKKTFTGTSKELASYNCLWDGSADNVPSFINETATATLSFENDPLVVTPSVNLTLAGSKNHDANGVLVSNFLVSKRYCCGFPTPLGWPSDYPPISNTDNTYTKPDGNNYLKMSGTPWQGGGSPYINYMTIAANCADVNYGTYFPLYADPAKVYFNIMVYGTGDVNTWLKIIIYEDQVAARSLDIKPNWTGWKLLSYNYTELIAGVTTAATPNKVTAVQFVLLSNSTTLPGPSVTTVFDHVIFTHNQPYQP